MARGYSILILPQEGTRIRRFMLSKRLLGLLFGGTAAALGLCGWVASNYLMLRLELRAVKNYLNDITPVETGIGNQRAQLSSLRELTGNIQHLLANWNGLQKRVRTSLPAKHRASANGHYPVEELEKSLVSLHGELERLIASVPTAWPTKGHVSSGIGVRKDPWTNMPEFHAGLDIPKPVGTPIHAPGDGLVDHVGSSSGNGNMVILDHGQGITTLYAHLSKIHVEEGQRVKRGEVIAAVGNTGKSTNPHLHYEVRVNGVPIDPRHNLIEEKSPSS